MPRNQGDTDLGLRKSSLLLGEHELPGLDLAHPP